MTLFDAVRDACADVAAQSQFVKLEADRLGPYAHQLVADHIPKPAYDPVHHYLGEPETTLAYVITLDAVNFGSGYFPHLQKRPGMSGYFTVSTSLKDHVAAYGSFSAGALAALSVEECAQLFAQDLADEVRAELMGLFSEALNDLGSYLLARFDGSFAALIYEANHSAERLATLLTEMPYFQDVANYHGLSVPLYKRAQITASDLSLALEGRGYGEFHDLDKLTIFADNLVPHVLRVDGLLHYDDALAARIKAGELIPAGSAAEIELRAVALHAVERLVNILQNDGHEVTAQQLDVLLWNKGQDPRYKALKRHRTRTVFY